MLLRRGRLNVSMMRVLKNNNIIIIEEFYSKRYFDISILKDFYQGIFVYKYFFLSVRCKSDQRRRRRRNTLFRNHRSIFHIYSPLTGRHDLWNDFHERCQACPQKFRVFSRVPKQQFPKKLKGTIEMTFPFPGSGLRPGSGSQIPRTRVLISFSRKIPLREKKKTRNRIHREEYTRSNEKKRNRNLP